MVALPLRRPCGDGAAIGDPCKPASDAFQLLHIVPIAAEANFLRNRPQRPHSLCFFEQHKECAIVAGDIENLGCVH